MVNLKKNVNIYIKEKRIALNLSQKEIAMASNMTINEYCDIEDYEDEVYMVPTLGDIDRICCVLEINLAELFGFDPNSPRFPKDIVQLALEKKKISTLSLSNEVGIKESYILNVEKEITNFRKWVMEPVITLSKVLGLNIGSILNSIAKSKHNGVGIMGENQPGS